MLTQAAWVNPARGGLFIEGARTSPLFFLFFGGAEQGHMQPVITARAAENKKNDNLGSVVSINRSSLRD